MTGLETKVAVVTGGTGGIGGGIARRLASRGAAVVLGGRDEQKAARVLADIEEHGGRASFVAGDVRDHDDMARLCGHAVEVYGGLDVVVANAGGDDQVGRTAQVRGPFAQLDLDQVAGFVRQAMLAKLQVVQASVPHLQERGGGSIVLITSEGGREATAGQTAMASLAGGLIMASKVLAKELARDHVRVNCVCVTLVRDTPSWESVLGEGATASEQHRRQYERIVERSPFGVADPGDIGEVVTFLASEDSRMLTGATLSPTGGLTIH